MISGARPSICQILFLGSRPAARSCIRRLVDMHIDCSIVGIVPHSEDQGSRADDRFQLFLEELRLPELELGAVESLNFDLGISIQFDRILTPSILKRSPRGFVNFHTAPLPMFRGVASATHAIRLAREEDNWTYGVTLHYIDEGVDTGPIIDELMFPILEDDTAYSLYERSIAKVPELFEKNIAALIDSAGRAPARSQSGSARIFKHRDLNHEIDLSWPADKIYDNVRALTFPGKPKPYVNIGPYRFYLTVE